MYNNNQQKGISISLAEFLFVYLKKRFGTQDAIAEWGYNLHFASKSFVEESVDCRLFYGILSGIWPLVLKIYKVIKRFQENWRRTFIITYAQL